MSPLSANEMMERARAAQPGWAALPVAQRCKCLANMRRNMAQICDVIAELVAKECGKHPLDALSGDVLVTMEHLRYCEKNAEKLLRAEARRKPSVFFRGTRFVTQYEPHGVALIFGASNYPLQLSLVPATTALAAGNAVILKCSERTPQTAALITRLCTDAGIPAGVVQVLHSGPEKALALVDARPDFLMFTGSSDVGRKIAERAAAQMIPCMFELGGKDASIVFADCEMERAIEGIVYGAFSNTGKVCVAVKRAYVEEPIYTEFVARLKIRTAELRIGPVRDADFPALSEQEQPRLREQVQDALARGAAVEWPASTEMLIEQPVILSGVRSGSRILTEETFGPVLCVAPFKDEDDAVGLANSTPFGLSGSVWTRNLVRARRVASRINAGSCAVNDVIRVIANPYVPFGGNGMSGYGRYHGAEGLRAFSRTKSILLTRSRSERERGWFPFDGTILRQLVNILSLKHKRRGFWKKGSGLIVPAALGILFPLGMAAQAKAESHLSVKVDLTAKAHGEVGYLAFASGSGFPGDSKKSVRHGFVPIPAHAREMEIHLELPPGTYAVTVYEDLNGNQKLDHNWIGIPREPVGVSNNPPAHFGPPKFSESSFQLGEEPKTITIRMVRP